MTTKKKELDPKKERELRAKRKEKLEEALYKLDDYICSCPWEVHRAFLFVRAQARKGVK